MRDGHRDGHYRSRANRQWLPRPQTVNDDVDDVLSTATPPFTSKRRFTPFLIAFVTLERDVHKCAPCLERYHGMTYSVLQVRAPIRKKGARPFHCFVLSLTFVRQLFTGRRTSVRYRKLRRPWRDHAGAAQHDRLAAGGFPRHRRAEQDANVDSGTDSKPEFDGMDNTTVDSRLRQDDYQQATARELQPCWE